MVFKKLIVSMMSCLGLAKQPTLPSPPTESGEPSSIDIQMCGSQRIKLSDGRFLAYTERGVPKNKSNYTVIVVHGFGSSKEMNFMASQDLLEEMKVCLLFFDRAGYGESDPNPKRSLKSEASDIDELADKLQLGSKFYVLGVLPGLELSEKNTKQVMWWYISWFDPIRLQQNVDKSCLMCRLAGVALVVPYINYKWPSLPNELTVHDYRKGLSRWTVFIASYAPRLLYWWLTQKLFPSSTVLDRNPTFFSRKDLDVLKNTPGYKLLSQNKIRDRTMFDSLRRDFVVAFGKWDFDPLEIGNPYLKKESTVHIWQGREDKVVPVQLQRYVSGKLPWIQYHEVPDEGHLLVYDPAVCEAILRSLLIGEDYPMYRPEC